ncbi:hypothetical protein LPJ61_003170 [Coemansia biformis]|uniref:Pre-mRNA processing factor 4 (PRP4)-like domain-containing protein n=1 Tax=Coemansia biformis TaxID=1286918 RepID=A0A9W7YD27_9FUNG|nr:hypothetical protein LPJ61_003170 [Coemansia biformis]
MSDPSRVHFGSLERDAVAYAKRKREEEGEEDREDAAQAATSGGAAAAGLLEVSGGSRARLPGADIDLDLIDEVVDEKEDQMLTEEALETRRRAMAEFERKRVARSIAVPTNDAQVKETLRKHGHPICLFGEDAGDRRSRLRYVLSKLAMAEKSAGSDQPADGSVDKSVDGRVGTESSAESSDDIDAQEEFYTEGPESLLLARQSIARFSLARARDRLERQREDCKVELATIRHVRQDLIKSLVSYATVGSQVGDTRPLARVVFTPDSQRILTGSWSGAIALWDIPGCRQLRSFRGHTDRVGGLSFHPQAGMGLGESVADFASGSSDNNVLLWSLEKETPIGSLKGHLSRVVHVGHHPSGDYLGSASYDGSWRLWDIATERELLLQEGHSREVFALRFQCDGSLVATAGLDGIGRVWDLRSGRSIMALEGHAKEIYAIDWSPGGFQVATGSADSTIRVFDLRKLSTVQVIPAHTSMVTDVRFFHAHSLGKRAPSGAADECDGHTDDDEAAQQRLCDGQYLASASNDGLLNIWTAGDWKLQKSLAGHVGKVLSVDIAGNGSHIASSGYDKTFKLWAAEDM